MATEINPLIIPFDSLLVTRSKREYRETVRGWGEEPCELEGLDGVTTAVRGNGCVIWVSKKIKGCDLYGLAAHEATHAACDMLDMIGEDEPAAEELAYMVQSITTGIIIACEGGVTMTRNVYGGYCRECGRWTPPGFGHFERRGRKWLVHCVKCASGRELPPEGDQAAQEMQKHIQNMKRDGRYGKRGYR